MRTPALLVALLLALGACQSPPPAPAPQPAPEPEQPEPAPEPEPTPTLTLVERQGDVLTLRNDTGGSIEVRAHRFGFDKGELELCLGQPTRVDDGATFTLTFDGASTEADERGAAPFFVVSYVLGNEPGERTWDSRDPGSTSGAGNRR